MKRALMVGWFVIFSAVVRGADLFELGNAAYQAGDYKTAQGHYEALVAEGRGGAALYYNLGNVYYRLGQMGRARLWYERALDAAPRDEDARFNRDLVRERVGETETAGDGLGSLSGAVWAAATAVNVLFFGLLAVGLYREEEWIWWGRWALGLLWVGVFAAAVAAQRHASVSYAVVVDARAEARTGPSAQEQVGFVAPEGHRVVLLDTLNDWVQIGVPAKGLKGWVPTNSIETVRLDTFRN